MLMIEVLVNRHLNQSFYSELLKSNRTFRSSHFMALNTDYKEYYYYKQLNEM